MLETYLTARKVILLAAVAVLLASGVIVTAFYRHISVPCHGALEAVPLSELPPLKGRLDDAGGNGVYVDFDVDSSKLTTTATYKNLRLRLLESECACKSELAMPGTSSGAYALAVFKNRATGLYVVREQNGTDFFAFRRLEVTGRKLRLEKAIDTSNLSMLILVGAMGALLGAAFLVRRAGNYALHMQGWRSATRRDDGVLEASDGATIGRLDRMTFRETEVLVNPARFEGRSVYREVPILNRRDVVPGSHERWTTGTYRCLRDARILAVLATLTTAVSVGAHYFAG